MVNLHTMERNLLKVKAKFKKKFKSFKHKEINKNKSLTFKNRQGLQEVVCDLRRDYL